MAFAVEAQSIEICGFVNTDTDSVLSAARAAVEEALTCKNQGALDSSWTASLSSSLCPLADGEAKLGKILHPFGWIGTQFRSPPDLKALLTALGPAPDTESQAAKVCLASEKVSLASDAMIKLDDIEEECNLRVYTTARPDAEIVAVIKGKVQDHEKVPVRVHSECFTGDILGSQRCDCGQQLHKYLQMLDREKCGILLYVRGHEGRGIGLANKIKAYRLQDEKGLDTVEANLKLGFEVDQRCYEESRAALQHIGVKSICLFTNNPEKVDYFADLTAEVKPLPSVPCSKNIGYLLTKAEKCGHRTVLEEPSDC